MEDIIILSMNAIRLACRCHLGAVMTTKGDQNCFKDVMESVA